MVLKLAPTRCIVVFRCVGQTVDPSTLGVSKNPGCSGRTSRACTFTGTFATKQEKVHHGLSGIDCMPALSHQRPAIGSGAT